MRNSSDEFIPCQKLQFSLFMFFQGRMLGVGVGPWEIWDGNGKYDLKGSFTIFLFSAISHILNRNGVWY